MIYDIINPSDPYTLKADDPALAAAACLVLGNGAYGLEDETGKRTCEIFVLGGDPLKWFSEKFGATLDDTLDRSELSEVLDSVMIGTRVGRAVAEDALTRMPETERQTFLEKRHDTLRGSMNDIGSRAWRLAKAHRELGRRAAAVEVEPLR